MNIGSNNHYSDLSSRYPSSQKPQGSPSNIDWNADGKTQLVGMGPTGNCSNLEKFFKKEDGPLTDCASKKIFTTPYDPVKYPPPETPHYSSSPGSGYMSWPHPESTPENPKVYIYSTYNGVNRREEFTINDIDPENATYTEMMAYEIFHKDVGNKFDIGTANGLYQADSDPYVKKDFVALCHHVREYRSEHGIAQSTDILDGLNQQLGFETEAPVYREHSSGSYPEVRESVPEAYGGAPAGANTGEASTMVRGERDNLSQLEEVLRKMEEETIGMGHVKDPLQIKMEKKWEQEQVLKELMLRSDLNQEMNSEVLSRSALVGA